MDKAVYLYPIWEHAVPHYLQDDTYLHAWYSYLMTICFINLIIIVCLTQKIWVFDVLFKTVKNYLRCQGVFFDILMCIHA